MRIPGNKTKRGGGSTGGMIAGPAERARLRLPAAVLALPVLITLFFSSCYLSNTPAYPNTAGFFAASLDGESASLEGKNISGLASLGRTVVAVSDTEAGIIVISRDGGVHWRQIPEGAIKDGEGIRFNTITYGEGYFLAGANGGQMAYSEDGENWQAVTIGPMNPEDILCMAAGRIQTAVVFAAAGTRGRFAYAVGSPEGPWYQSSLTPFSDGSWGGDGESVRAMAWGKIKSGAGVFVAVGDDGKIAFMDAISGSYAGKWFAPTHAGTNKRWRAVTFEQERFLAVGEGGTIAYSTDPRTYEWVPVPSDDLADRSLAGVAFEPLRGCFALFTDDTVLAFSEFGDAWQAAQFNALFPGGTPSNPEGISAICASDGRVILGGTQGTLVYSNNNHN